ncbi:formyltransferase family protein [Pseudomonas sp. CC120222-01a]|uniref:formyltransferase family protein n=1 Tax=Pseudomonas sp. CC120222-01a TaxID=1378075 RepID=UPI000D820B1D|nr:formyltransferase family protein [Pseudomonas sp. CC120222-01a]PVZ43714.1 folate-dependent phosphoribosylglycinamide formyltransferase PurN [Pseudomonas sp. CC120222-01a]
MIRIAFLCSGGGGNLRFIAEVIRLGLLPARLVMVVTDRECLANRFACENQLPNEIIDFTEPGQASLLRLLEAASVDIIITNVHRIIHPAVVQAFAKRLLNLHYSLLPAYGAMIGTKPVEAALQAGSLFIGTTAHLVDFGVDTGPPLVQSAIPLQQGDTLPSVMDTVFRTGCLCLLNAILLHTGSPVRYCGTHLVHGRTVLSNPGLAFDQGPIDDDMWQRIADYPSPAR